MMSKFDIAIDEELAKRLSDLERHLKGDVVFFYGEIAYGIVRFFRDFIERMTTEGKADCLYFFLNTPGGSVEVAEKMVDIIRHHYDKVFFVVPDVAYSAGTILCMSGDKIYMDYSSSLGPIDPQVWNGEQWVPALGYLDKVEEMIEKAKNSTLTNAEFINLQNQDLALLSKYEQARDLTVTLLKKWLVEYKFRNWKVNETKKIQRAEEIATALGDNKMWHSHGRMISSKTLQESLNLEIDDYSEDETLRTMIRSYNDLLTEYIARQGYEHFFHSRAH